MEGEEIFVLVWWFSVILEWFFFFLNWKYFPTYYIFDYCFIIYIVLVCCVFLQRVIGFFFPYRYSFLRLFIILLFK